MSSVVVVWIEEEVGDAVPPGTIQILPLSVCVPISENLGTEEVDCLLEC